MRQEEVTDREIVEVCRKLIIGVVWAAPEIDRRRVVLQAIINRIAEKTLPATVMKRYCDDAPY